MQEELLTEEARVIASSNGFADLEIIRNDNCEHCSAKLICRGENTDVKVIKVKDTLDTNPGDKVKISIRGKTVAGYSFLLYGLPLLLLVSVVFTGQMIFSGSSQPELYSFLLAAAVTAIYYSVFFGITRIIKAGPGAGMIVMESKIPDKSV